MREHDSSRQDTDPYWQVDFSLGRFKLHGEDRPVYLQLHRSDEAYHERRELVALSYPTGERTYFHAKPYLIVPRIELTVGLMPHADPDAPIGQVLGSEITNVRKHEIGQAQAWYYHGDKLLVLWECYSVLQGSVAALLPSLMGQSLLCVAK